MVLGTCYQTSSELSSSLVVITVKFTYIWQDTVVLTSNFMLYHCQFLVLLVPVSHTAIYVLAIHVVWFYPGVLRHFGVLTKKWHCVLHLIFHFCLWYSRLILVDKPFFTFLPIYFYFHMAPEWAFFLLYQKRII